MPTAVHHALLYNHECFYSTFWPDSLPLTEIVTGKLVQCRVCVRIYNNWY